ncbi:MAG: hypothetical protein JWM11_1108, partial [Planctomycetaceae bacterium]|nr:hypothetical protein [Planctomycetaceae bacterium]
MTIQVAQVPREELNAKQTVQRQWPIGVE